MVEPVLLTEVDSRKYVPTTKKFGKKGTNSRQLGGRSRNIVKFDLRVRMGEFIVRVDDLPWSRKIYNLCSCLFSKFGVTS